ncbi:MAG: 2-C-methyl-D-erythritol 4-phosphate cytidylyltransferase, partial [Clostridia bacterium]|nr:2-C-methyl-D-erythritol 4-phosphate cytidylyltransferase [Clostridia bacterium]
MNYTAKDAALDAADVLRAASKHAGKRNYTAAIIVAGGSGTRMGTETTKQLLELCGKPVV